MLFQIARGLPVVPFEFHVSPSCMCRWPNVKPSLGRAKTQCCPTFYRRCRAQVPDLPGLLCYMKNLPSLLNPFPDILGIEFNSSSAVAEQYASNKGSPSFP